MRRRSGTFVSGANNQVPWDARGGMACYGRMSRPRLADPISAEGMVRTRFKRADGSLLGNNLSGTLVLTEFYARVAAGLVARSALEMLRLDALPVGAIVVIVIDIPVRRRIFERIGVVRSYLCHRLKLLQSMLYASAHVACAAPARPSLQLLSLELGSTPSAPSRSAGKASLNWIGCRSAWFHFTPFFGDREPARLPRCWRSTKRGGCAIGFADQVFIR